MTKPLNVNGPLRVLLIGAGRRIQNNFLPALHCLANDFQVVGIHSRTKDRLLPVAERWGVPAITSLENLDFESIDVVAVSVPTSSNATILRELHKRLPSEKARRLSVVVDTPLAWTRSEFREVLPQIEGFGQVAVAEDYMNYPPFELVRRAVSASIIGKPRALTLTNTGYLYHGLALIRSFVDFQPALATSRVKLGNFGINVRYRFRGGFEAHVIGPYRSHTTGGLLLEGDKGIITEFPADRGKDASKNWNILSFRRVDGILSECVIEGSTGEMVESMPAIAIMANLPFDDKSDLNLLRGCGLIAVFRSLLNSSSINNRYGYKNALYDSCISQRASHGKFPFDPFVLVGSDAISMMAKIAGARR